MNNFTYSIPTKISFWKGQISHLSELSESGNKFYYAMAVEVSKKQEFMTKQSRF